MDGKNVWKKTGFGILFVAACFTSAYILMAFHDKLLLVLLAAVILLTSAFLFLNEVFMDKVKNRMPQEEEPEALEPLSSGNSSDGEFRLKISKHMKEMENGQKELIDVLKKQNTMLQSQIENLEHEIYMLSEKQVNQTKSVIKFNKENARQLAISERETLEYVMLEIKKSIEDNAGGVRQVAEEETPGLEIPYMPEMPVAEEPEVQMEAAPIIEEKPEEEVSAPELEELVASELFEVSDLLGDDEIVIPDMPAPEEIADLANESVAQELLTEEIEIPEISDDLDLSALFEDMASEALAEETEVPVMEEEPIAVPEPEIQGYQEEVKKEEPANDPLAGLGGDPNAMMTPEDIAKLLASMGQ